MWYKYIIEKLHTQMEKRLTKLRSQSDIFCVSVKSSGGDGGGGGGTRRHTPHTPPCTRTLLPVCAEATWLHGQRTSGP